MRYDEFWQHVDRSGGPNGCWEWLGGRFHFGHGAARVLGVRDRRAHRIAWLMTHGSLPEDQCVLHQCDNAACCNPAHLFLGTRAENNADMMRKGRNVPPRLGRFNSNCLRCGAERELLPNGKRRKCRPCGAARTRLYRERHRDECRAKDREYARERRKRQRQTH